MKKFYALILACVMLFAMTVPAALASVAAPGDDCTPTEDSYTAWVDSGPGIVTEENVAPGENTDTVRYVPVGSVDEPVQTGTQEVFDYWQRYSLVGGSWPEGVVPAFPDPGEPFRWQPNVKADPHGIGKEGAYSVSNEQSGNTDWFYLEMVMKEVPVWGTDTDYLWQKQVRELVKGEDCPPVDCPDGDFNGDKPGCNKDPLCEVNCDEEPPVDEPKESNVPDEPKADKPDAPRTATPVAVPTSVDAGLVSAERAVDSDSGDEGFEVGNFLAGLLFGAGIGLLAAVALSRFRR